jgi:hypothetical protein
MATPAVLSVHSYQEHFYWKLQDKDKDALL